MKSIMVIPVVAILTSCIPLMAGERTERFDSDPGWDGFNNRAMDQKPQSIRQDFGYSAGTSHAGGSAGEIGGFITPAAEPAYYGKRIDVKSLNDSLSASGRLLCRDRQFHATIGFFNAGTVNEWRTPNTIAIRLLGRGDIYFAYVEYATSQWRAGADTPGGFATEREPSGRLNLRGFRRGVPVRWSLKYDPNGHAGGGTITVTIGSETAICHLDQGHKADGATFNRFGIMPILKSADSGGELWLDDVEINGAKNDFARDPGWEGLNNRHRHDTTNIRPRFDFGFSQSHHAGGLATGELGGLIFRGDCRYATKLAAYGDRLATVTLDKPLRASGKISLRRAVSDSTTLLGFYHSTKSLTVNPAQSSGIPQSFLGLAIEGPSRDGFFVYPMYRVAGDGQGYADGPTRPRILPDGKAHDWSLVFDPSAAGGRGRVSVTLDGKSTTLELTKGHRGTETTFDRFGLVTTWIDGNGQHVYFDDLTYTCAQ